MGCRRECNELCWSSHFANEGKQRLNFRLEEVFRALDTNPAFRIIPLTTEVAHEVVTRSGDASVRPW